MPAPRTVHAGSFIKTKGKEKTPHPSANNKAGRTQPHHPPVKKRGRREASPPPRDSHKQAHRVVEEEPDVPLDQALLRPTWASPLVKLDARASQATREDNDYQDLYLQCRVIRRRWGPSVSPAQVITYAISMHGVSHHDRPCNISQDPHPDDELELTHLALPEFFPDWENVVPLLKKDPGLIVKLGRYIEKVGGKTRSDDLARLKSKVLWAAGIEDPKGALADKRNRGARNHEIARVLTPLSKLDRFDDDPALFCQDVLEGRENLHSIDWWSGMYDLSRSKPGQFRPGLLMSEFALRCYDIIWNSRNSGEYENPTGKKKKGQPSLSKKYKVNEVTLHSILYCLNLGRHSLNNQAEWSEVDGAWKVAEFNQSIVDYAMKNLKWFHNLLKWKIYGDVHDEVMNKDEYKKTSFYMAITYECDSGSEEDFADRPAKPLNRPSQSRSPAQCSGLGASAWSL
ncbi:hypothetical protein C8T65DRAFT_748830 [Cerioporus squamosus]|nr:hypothetical protein C8T65DRAFT_748830 [Cerioporus squamosus]